MTDRDHEASKRLSVLWIGEEATGQRGLRRILARDVDVLGVITSTESIRKVADSEGIATLSSDTVRSAPPARLPAVDLLLNVHSLHRLSAPWLMHPRIGAFNLHPGPLPECAGLNAPSWSIWHDANEHGTTLHWMEDAIDAGPIAFAERFPLTPTDTGLSVATRTAKLGLDLLDAVLDAARGGGIPRRAQDLHRRRLYPAGPPADGEFDWRWPVECIIRLWRACDYGPFGEPWGSPWFSSEDGPIRVRRLSIAPPNSPVGNCPGIAHTSGTQPNPDSALEIGCGSGAVRLAEVRLGSDWVPAGRALHLFDGR